MRRKRKQPAPTPNTANPYMVERKAAMLRARITAVEVHEHVKRAGGTISVATVREVINGTFRNDDVIEVFCLLTGITRAAAFPATELEWIALHRRAERSALEAAG